MSNVLRELRLAIRTLGRQRGFSVVAILTLALVIAACTAIYSIVHGVLLRPLPYTDADRLVQVWQVNRTGGRMQFSEPNFEDLRDQSRAFASFALHAHSTRTAVIGNAPLRMDVAAVSSQFFEVFQTPPLMGRTFEPGEQRRGGPPVAVISHGLWQRTMSGADLTAAAVKIGDRTYSVVGVMPGAFRFPEGVDVWTPSEQLERNPHRTGHNWRAVGRISASTTLDTARADVTAVARRLESALGDDTWMADAALVPLHEQIAGSARRPLLILLAAVGCLIVIACANLANLLLVHASARRRELAVRAALGASRTSLSLPLLAETAILAAAGGTLGLALGVVALRAVLALESGYLPRAGEIAVRWPVVLVALAVTVSTAAVLGLVSAWGAVRSDLVESLKQGQRGQAGSASTGRLRNVLVVAQLAVSVVLLVGAGLLGRSLALLLSQDPGFRPEGVLTIDISSPSGTPELDRRRVDFHQRLLDRLAALPEVQASGGISRFPLGSGYSNGTFIRATGGEKFDDVSELGELMKDKSRTGQAEFRVASSGYFRAMNIPLVRGRLFDERDAPDAPHVALISHSLAASGWPGGDPIGQGVQFGNIDGDLRLFTIVGVVGDIRERGLDTAPRPTFYADYRQRPRVTGSFTVVLHAPRDATALVAPARAAIRELDAEVAPRFRTIEEVFAASVADRRFSLFVLAAFAGAALLLAVLGTYGVLAYAVSQRTQEFGVRLALGAQPRDVWRLVLRQAALLVLIGVAIGLIASRLVTQIMSSMLFGISPADPVTFGAVVVILAVTALLACHVPALRATRVDPMTALRAE